MPIFGMGAFDRSLFTVAGSWQSQLDILGKLSGYGFNFARVSLQRRVEFGTDARRAPAGVFALLDQLLRQSGCIADYLDKLEAVVVPTADRVVHAILWPCELLFWFYGLALLLAALLFEMFIYLALLTLLAGTWGVLYHESYKALRLRLSSDFRQTHRAANVRTLLERYLEADERATTREAFQASLAFYLEQTGGSSDFFLRICEMDKEGLTDVAQRCRNASAKDLPEFEFYLDTSYQLAGLFLEDLFPLPYLQQIQRPFRFQAILRCLRTVPGSSHFAFLAWVKTNLDLREPTEGPTRSLMVAIAFFCEARLCVTEDFKADHRAAFHFVESVASDPAFPALERKAQEAILEMILEWKTKKEAFEEQEKQGRLKQE
ncbi:hypothetical protein JCM8547_002923 [Rhodosporidiobolus lusitaniae]